MSHPTYIINLEERSDRRKHINDVFKNKKEFNTIVFNAIKDKNGSKGLFLSIREIVIIAQSKKLPYIIVCEDDHEFTASYNPHVLEKQINLGLLNRFEILLGGPSNIHDAYFYNENTVWLSGFTGLQFTVIFNFIYEEIISFELKNAKSFDLELGELSNEIYCCYPPISIQKYFGYSDATSKNNHLDVKLYFDRCLRKLNRIYKVSKYFNLIVEKTKTNL